MYRRIFVVLMVLAFLVAACGDDDGGTTAAPTTTVAPSTTAGAEATLRWRTRPDNDQEAGVYRSVSETLDAQLAGVTLVYEAGGSVY